MLMLMEWYDLCECMCSHVITVSSLQPIFRLLPAKIEHDVPLVSANHTDTEVLLAVTWTGFQRRLLKMLTPCWMTYTLVTLQYMLQLVKAFLVHAIIIVVFSWF